MHTMFNNSQYLHKKVGFAAAVTFYMADKNLTIISIIIIIIIMQSHKQYSNWVRTLHITKQCMTTW